MYAVIETGGKQYRVEVGTELEVELLDAEPGQAITLDRVLLVADGDDVGDRPPARRGRRRQRRGRSARPAARSSSRSSTARRRARRVKKGHRQDLMVLRITDVRLGSKSAADAVRKADADAKTERQRLEEAAAKQAAADAELAAKLAKAAEAREGRRGREAEEGAGQAEGDRGRPRPPRRRRRRPGRRRRPTTATADKPAPPTRRPRRRPPARRRTSNRHGPQESWFQLEERPRQRRPAARREGRRRPARLGRLDHRPPARPDVPRRARAPGSVMTTPSSRRRPATSGSSTRRSPRSASA